MPEGIIIKLGETSAAGRRVAIGEDASAAARTRKLAISRLAWRQPGVAAAYRKASVVRHAA